MKAANSNDPKPTEAQIKRAKQEAEQAYDKTYVTSIQQQFADAKKAAADKSSRDANWDIGKWKLVNKPNGWPGP